MERWSERCRRGRTLVERIFRKPFSGERYGKDLPPKININRHINVQGASQGKGLWALGPSAQGCFYGSPGLMGLCVSSPYSISPFGQQPWSSYSKARAHGATSPCAQGPSFIKQMKNGRIGPKHPFAQGPLPSKPRASGPKTPLAPHSRAGALLQLSVILLLLPPRIAQPLLQQMS